MCVCEVFDGDVGDPEQNASGGGEQERLAVMFDVVSGRDPHEPDAERQDRALDRDQRRKRGALRPL
jgi:hypothetical protein